MATLGANITGLGTATQPELRPGGPRPVGGSPAEFRDKLSALTNAMPTTGNAPTAAPKALRFSNHAIERMQTRGIRFSPEDMGKIQNAVAKAAGKGSKDSLLITDTAALVVSVKDNTVVTVMDKASLKDNVFTKIDSTVVI